jgi:hypothetical protein
MKPELLTNRDAAITTYEENVRARAYELYEVRGRIDAHAEEDGFRQKGRQQEATNARPSEPQPHDRYGQESSETMIGPSRSGEPCSNHRR